MKNSRTGGSYFSKSAVAHGLKLLLILLTTKSSPILNLKRCSRNYQICQPQCQNLPALSANPAMPPIIIHTVILVGELSGIGPWSQWIHQARHYAASMAEVKHHHPLPVEDHHFAVIKLVQCQGIPSEVFGFLGAPKVKFNPLPTPFLTPSMPVTEKDHRYRQRALRLLSPLLLTRHLGGALARIIQATDDESN